MTHKQQWLIVPAVVVLAAIVWVIAVPVGGVDLDVTSGDTIRTIGFGSIVVVSAVVAVLAVVVRRLLGRISGSGSGKRSWTIVAGIVLALSLLGPAGAQGSAALVTLVLLHVLVGGALIVGLERPTVGQRAS